MKSKFLAISLLLLAVVLVIEVEGASPWTISFSAPVDTAISRTTIFRNALITASPGPAPTPTPWTDQLTFESGCRTGVLNMISATKVATGVNFCQQWNNIGNILPACSTTPPAIAYCAFTAAQKVTLCQAAGRPNSCDLCP